MLSEIDKTYKKSDKQLFLKSRGYFNFLAFETKSIKVVVKIF